MSAVFQENPACDEADVTSWVRCVADLSSKRDSNPPSAFCTEDSHYSGWTPLLRACRNGQTEIVAHLLSNGADPTVQDALGWNAVPLAVASGNTATVKEILKAIKWNRKDLAPALCVAALNGNCEIADILLAARASSNEPIEVSGITPLMLAAGEGHLEMVIFLLEKGADPDITNALHQTALDASVIRDHLAVQNILGPVTHLRSKISSHIPLPISPPNRALQSPNSFHSDIRFLGASPLMNHCHNHSPGLGSSPMLHYVQIPSPACASFCLPSGNLVSNSPILKNKGFLSPLPASHPLLVSPFNFPRTAAPMSPCRSQCPGFCQNVGGCSQKRSGEGVLNQRSIAKGNKRLRKWWCQMKRRCRGNQPNNEFPDEDTYLNVAMEKRLANFLRSIKMIEYYPLFKYQEVDFETFLTLTDEDLDEIGVKNPSHRSKIVEKIKKFSKSTASI